MILKLNFFSLHALLDPITEIIKAYANKMGKELFCTSYATCIPLIKLAFVIVILCQDTTFSAAGI